MNSLAWTGIILWGILLTGFGLGSGMPQPAEATVMAAHDVTFLIAGGLLTCLIGAMGLMGLLGRTPALRNKQKNAG